VRRESETTRAPVEGESAARVREITARLEALYGVAEWTPKWTAEEELVSCILSQHTSDVNSLRAFDLLQRQYPTWDAVIDAPADELADTIRCGGLANQKAPRIQEVLRQIRAQEGSVSLACLNVLPNDEARNYLMRLPGVGPKTAAIGLCFALGRPVIPVDTHIFRVSWRLGLIEKRIGEAKAHDVLQTMVPEDIIYRFHVALIRHGRQICKAPTPRCEICPLTDLCRYYTEGGQATNA
jgi:endonuclease-3